MHMYYIILCNFTSVNPTNAEGLLFSALVKRVHALAILILHISVSRQLQCSVQEVSSIRTLGDSQCADGITTDRE